MAFISGHIWYFDIKLIFEFYNILFFRFDKFLFFIYSPTESHFRPTKSLRKTKGLLSKLIYVFKGVFTCIQSRLRYLEVVTGVLRSRTWGRVVTKLTLEDGVGFQDPR